MIAVLIFGLAVSTSLNIWQFNNVREVEKIVYAEVPVEVPIEVSQTNSLERFYLKGSEHFTVQFNDGNTDGTPYDFVHGTFIESDIALYGEWDVMITFRFCEMENITLDLTNIEIKLENCTVQNSYFEGTFDSAVHLSGSSFIGSSTFNVSVVNGTGNTGLENVTFEGIVVQGD